MAYYFVCDGGGTKTESLLFDSEGRILATAKGSGANALFLEKNRALETVLWQINSVLEQAGITVSQLKGVYLFIPGFRFLSDAVKDYFNPETELMITGDELPAFYGALGQPEGVSVLAGTGSFAAGKTKNSKLITAGGWGPVMGDLGSGYDIGRSCLQKLAILYDTGDKDNLLAKIVLKELGKSSMLEVRRMSSQPELDRAKIASLCPVVAEAARQGDQTAVAILQEAAEKLASLAEIVIKKLEKKKLPVVLIGGVEKIGDIFFNLFEQEIKKRVPEAWCREPAYTPVVGGMLYVLSEVEKLDITDPNVLKNIKKDG